jgi:alkylhydroperoxidase family enzyme
MDSNGRGASRRRVFIARAEDAKWVASNKCNETSLARVSSRSTTTSCARGRVASSAVRFRFGFTARTSPSPRLANCFRVSPKLDKRLIELIVLLVCRDATAQYAWSAHFNLAREAGISAETIEAIRARRRPEFGRDDERIVYDLVTELLASKKVSPATYGRAEAALGRDGIIEAVTCAGFYGMIGLVLNTFEIPPQPGGDVLI